MLVIYHADTGQIRQISRNTPLGDVPPEMIPEGCAALKTDRADFTPQSHRVDARGRIIKKRAADVEAQEVAEAWRQLRQERAARLAASDWVTHRANENNEAVPAEWKVYRQALRDLPENTTDPRNPEWPEMPE